MTRDSVPCRVSMTRAPCVAVSCHLVPLSTADGSESHSKTLRSSPRAPYVTTVNYIPLFLPGTLLQVSFVNLISHELMRIHIPSFGR